MDYLPHPHVVRRTDRVARRRATPKPVEQWRGSHLYEYLRDKADPGLRVQLTKAPLVGNFNRWIDAGLTPTQVRAMLDAFLTREDWHHVPGWLAWRVLIAKRGDLQQMVSKLQQQEEAKVRRTDKDYWLGNPRAD